MKKWEVISARALGKVDSYSDLRTSRLCIFPELKSNRYSVALEEIAEEVARESRSLTKSRLDDYYYEVRDDEVVLLSPPG